MAVTIRPDDSPDEKDEKLANWERENDAPEKLVDYLNREYNRKPKSVSTRQTHLTQYAQWLNDMGLKPENADHKQVSEYLWGLERDGYAGSTVKAHYRTLRHFYNYLTDWERVIEESPIEPLSSSDFGEPDNGKDRERAKKRKYVRFEEKEKLKENVPSPKLRNVLMIELIWQTGLREREVVELEVSDINRDDRQITIWGKGGKRREVFFKPSLDSLLDRYLNFARPEFYGADGPYLFPSRQSQQLTRGRPTAIIRDAAENAGILEELPPDVNGNSRYWPGAHALRHGHAVEALRSPDITLRDLQQQLGHHSLEVTEKYLDMVPEDRRKAYQSFGAHRGDD